MSRQDKTKSGSFLESWFKGGKKGGGTVPRGPGAQATSRPTSETDFGDPEDQTDQKQYELTIEMMDEKELNAKFEELLNDMNINGAKKDPLQKISMDQKKQMLIMQYIGAKQEIKSKYDKPNQYIEYLSNPELSSQKILNCVESLRIALTNNTLSWVNDFGTEGMRAIYRTLKLSTSNNNDIRFEKIQQECLKCILKFTNNTEGLKSFFKEENGHIIVAKCIDFKKPQVSILALQILAALCLLSDNNPRILGTDKALSAVTLIGEERDLERFVPITDCITKSTHNDLWANCLKFMNALLSQTDDFEFRVHLRNEIFRNGLHEVYIEKLRIETNPMIKTQFDIFESGKDDDGYELNQRFDNVKIDMEDITDCFEVLKNTTLETNAEPYFLSILQHLLFIRDDHNVRGLYYKLIEECVSQIVLHKSGLDPDFKRKNHLNIDLQQLFDELKDRPLPVDDEKIESIKKQLEEALAAKEEALAKLSINEGRGIGVASSSNENTVKPGPPPPPMPGGTGGPPPPPMPGGFGGPPPPPMPGGGGGPPPPPMPGGGGGPPPPPMMGMGPPPPPMMGMGGPMPPPMFGGGKPICLPGMGQPDVLPHGLKPKKKWDVGKTMKKANWKTILPQKMTEKSFWVKVKEEDMTARDDILKGLEQRFTSKPVAKKVDELDKGSNTGTMKKAKELKVLDGKSAQNISILLGGSLKHTPYDEIKACLLKCDETVITENVLEQLIQYLPPADQLVKLQQFRESYSELTEAEQFCVKMSEINRLLPRLKSLKFRQNYKEMVNDVKPDIVAGTAACEEVKKSRKFAKLLELILLFGNYMNSGTRNAQAFGFEISFLTKLTGTKDINNKQTLLHYIVETAETQFPELLNFCDEVPHIDRASRVSLDSIQKILNQMDNSIKNLQMDLTNNRKPQSADDQFCVVMEQFSKEAREQCDVMQKMFKKMDNLYTDISEFYAFDKQKYTLEEFFTDLKTFKDSFLEAKRDNEKERELIEKNKKAKLAKEKAEKEKLEREARKKAIIDMNPSETQEGVMDSLLEALQTGSAFSQQKRKRQPRPHGEDIWESLVVADRRALLARSRSRTNIIGRELRGELVT